MSMVLTPGFEDAARDSQAVFRALLDAMARPGRIHDVSVPRKVPPPLNNASAAVLLALVDVDTPLWIDGQAMAVSEWVAFHCGAPAARVAEARFCLALTAPPLSSLFPGSDDEPESSATLILQVAALGEGVAFRLEGPGLPAPTSLLVAGLNDQFVGDWHENRRLFPCGIDVILCAPNRIAALPRTLKLERE